MKTNATPFNYRAFVALMSLISLAALIVTGVALAVGRHSEIFSHSWSHAHAINALVFVVFATWHAVLNRRALVNHIKGSRMSAIGTEAIYALAIVILVVVLYISHGGSNH